MSTTRDRLTRNLLLLFAGIGSVGLLTASIALLTWARNSSNRTTPSPTPSNVVANPNPHAPAIPAANIVKPTTPTGKRFTLRLGQAFRFKDAVVVTAKPDDAPDITFKYVAPLVGGMSTRYNPISQQVETGLEPTLTSPAPLLLSIHINAFDARPNVAAITTGDIATYGHQITLGAKTHYFLLMSQPGDQYLLTLDELQAPLGKYDDWRIGFTYEKVTLPLGLAGGKINRPLPGKLIFRDWYRFKMILRVDLATGKQDAISDGELPCTVGDRLFAYADSASAYVIRDAAGKVLHTVRFNERFLGPLLSPDGTRIVGSVYRNTPGRTIGNQYLPGPAALSVGVFDLQGHEITSIVGYDDATWTPDGKLIATGTLYEPGLFEIDPATKNVRPIAPNIASPFAPNVSPDGKMIAFTTGNKVWLIDRDGTNLRQPFQDGHNQQRPAFSPDGTKLAVIICNQIPVDDTGEVFVIDLKTQEVIPIRTSTGLNLLPDTSTRLNWIP